MFLKYARPSTASIFIIFMRTLLVANMECWISFHLCRLGCDLIFGFVFPFILYDMGVPVAMALSFMATGKFSLLAYKHTSSTFKGGEFNQIY